MLRRLSHPLFTLFLALLLFFDAFHLPSGIHGSRVGCWIKDQPYITTAQAGGGPSAVLLLGRDGAWSIHPREHFITDPALQREADASVIIPLFAELRENHWSCGFWAITSRGYTISGYAYYNGGSRIAVSRQTLADARVAFLDWLVETQSLPPAEAVRLRPGNIRHSETAWLGVAHSLAALLVALTLILSLGWIPRLIDRLTRDNSRDALIARGLCPNCRYSIRGLNSGICPECGHETSPTEPLA